MRNTFAIQFTRYYFIVATINALITLLVWRILDFGYIIGTATTAPFDGLMWITGWFVDGIREGSIFPIDSVLVIVLLVIPSLAARKFNATKDDRTTSSSSDSVEAHVIRWTRAVWITTGVFITLLALNFVIASFSVPLNPADLVWLLPNVLGAVVSALWTIRNFRKQISIDASGTKESTESSTEGSA
ncbi:MAG: hypothetical protein ACKOWP_01065 [Microbacteriaceae bacterium]